MRRVLLVLVVAALLVLVLALPSFADGDPSDSQLRHKIQVIKNHPGPLTNQERQHIQNLRERIHDNDNDDCDDHDDDDC